jgi:hypothetical protein
LVFYQDPLFTSTSLEMPLRKLQTKTAWNLNRRLEEDEEPTKKWWNTALERRRLYDKVCADALEAMIEKRFRYNHHKIAFLWLGIMDLLQFLPNLETFRSVTVAPTSRFNRPNNLQMGVRCRGRRGLPRSPFHLLSEAEDSGA